MSWEQWIYADPEDTFFDVQLRPLWWEDVPNPSEISSLFEERDNLHPCKDFLAVVDMEHKHVFAAVTKKSYALYLHEWAYNFGIWITSNILSEKQDDIRFLSLRATDYCAAIEYNFCSKISYTQPEILDGWIPCITIGNSYNKTKTLECIIGFHNKNRNVNVFFPGFTSKSKSAHVNDPRRMEEDIWKQVESNSEKIREFIRDFKMYLDTLKRLPIADSDILPLFCKIQGIKRHAQELEMQMAHLKKVLVFVTEKINEHRPVSGHNAYSLLMIMADYVDNFNRDSNTLRSSGELNLGKWLLDYIGVATKPDYSPYDYIGKEAYDTASWFGMLR